MQAGCERIRCADDTLRDAISSVMTEKGDGGINL
jgi:hypothetical protein